MRPLLVPKLRLTTAIRRACVAAVLLASTVLPRAALASSGSCAGAPVAVAGAAFATRRAPDGLTWDARFVLGADTVFDGVARPIRFAAPLPEGEHMVPAAGLEPFVDGGRVVGVCVQPAAVHGRTVPATFVQSTSISIDRAIPLGAPIAAGESVQIVDTSAGDVRLEIASDALEKHVGFVAPRAVSDGAREEARRLTGVQPKIHSGLAYLRGQDVGRGLEVRLFDPPARRRTSAAGVVVLFLALVAALLVAARRLRARAEVERADAILASEIARAGDVS